MVWQCLGRDVLSQLRAVCRSPSQSGILGQATEQGEAPHDLHSLRAPVEAWVGVDE